MFSSKLSAATSSPCRLQLLHQALEAALRANNAVCACTVAPPPFQGALQH